MLQIDNSLLFPLLVLMSFLLGSVPSGFVISRIYGIDIRDHGSKNIGSTNVYRVLGKFPAFLTFFLDLIKGVLAMLLAKTMVPSSDFYFSVAPILGISAISGHCFSPFLSGQGGKGVATSFGVFLYLLPYATLFSLLTFVLVFYFSRYVSLASLFATITLLSISFCLRGFTPITFSILVTTMIITFRHKDNISRLLAGKENRFSRS